MEDEKMEIICIRDKREYSGRLTVFRKGRQYEAFVSGRYLCAVCDDGVTEAIAFKQPYENDSRFRAHFAFV